VQLALTEPQEQFVFSEASHPALVAGLGSGKTEAAICRLLIRMVQQPGIDTAFYLPTYDLIKLRAMPGTEERLSQLGINYTANRSDYAIKLHGYGTMIFRSYDRPERIVSYEVADSIVDELDTLPKEKAAFVWRKVSERNRQKCGRANTIGNVTTPDQGYSGFTYAKWVKQKQPGYELIKAATASNPFLPDGYIEQIRANYDPILANMYLEGEFVSLSQNKVYHFFDKAKHHRDRELLQSDMVVCIGLDFNVGGTCATVWVIEDNKPIAVDEFVSHDTQDFCLRADKYKAHGRQVIVYPDASGDGRSTNASVTDLDIIRQSGFRVDAPKANPAIRDRINSVNALLSHDKMAVNTNRCPLLTDALESQGYDKRGSPEKFNDHPAIDDWADCAGYFIHRKYPINKPIIFTGIGSAM
jgi:PBSX family phage terminase large subunit